MTSVCLGMIVRDCEDVVARCINSCLALKGHAGKPLVDRAVIIDTGSIDNTLEVIQETLGDERPATYIQSEWVGHAHNRTELLEYARQSKAEYTLMPDADMELIQTKPMRPLEADEYSIPIRDRGLYYPLPLLTSNAKTFKYEGVAHAYLACEEGRVERVVVDEFYLWDHGGGGHREGKIERDRDLLGAEVGKNPLDTRSAFYLAQSFRDLDQYPEAIAMYKYRATLGGWDEEVYQALYNAGMLLSAHVNFYDGAKLLIAAAEMKQNRAEAPRGLARCAEAVADKIPFPEDEVLFVEPNAYKHQGSRPARDEVEEIFFHRYIPKPGDTVVELGASQGSETILLSRLVGPEGLVVAVEPDPTSFKDLYDNVASMNNVRLVEAAVSNWEGEGHLSQEGYLWHSRISDDGVEIKVALLDSVTQNLDRIDLLKINVEGEEADLLSAASETLAKTQNIVVSCHDFLGILTKARVRAILSEHGFNVQEHDDPLIIPDGHQGRCLGDYLYAARPVPMPPLPSIKPTVKRLRRKKITQKDVTAIMVTRGNVDLQPCLDALEGFDEVAVWDNSVREHDYKIFGRFAAIPECRNSVIAYMDDDVIFRRWDELLKHYEPGVATANMDLDWRIGAGYEGELVLFGAGSVMDSYLPEKMFDWYLSEHPWDDEVLVECDFILGTLVDWKVVDIPFEVREFSDGPGRLWNTEGQTQRKWRTIARCKELKERRMVAA